MKPNSTAAAVDDPEVLYRWSARKLRPVVLLYVAAVFLAFILTSYVVFDSMTAVTTLAMTAVASIVPLVPAVLNRVEYRITDRRLERRMVNKQTPAAFETVVRFDELSHVVPTMHGLVFYRPLKESNPLLRFWKAHVSDVRSGEIQIETADRERVIEILLREGIPSR